MPSLTITQKLYAGFAAILSIVLILVMLILQNVEKIEAAVKATNHTYEVILETEHLLDGILNMETGARGFLITGKESFLEPYTAGRQLSEKSALSILELTKDNPKQGARIAQFNEFLGDWEKNVLGPQIALRKEISIGRAEMSQLISDVATGKGKARVDKMRDALEQIADEEKQLLSVRAEDAAKAKQQTILFLVAGAALIALLGAGIALTTSRSISKRIRIALDITASAANGDFSRNIDPGQQDEIGILLTALSEMQTKLRSLLFDVRRSAEALLESANRINDTSNQIAIGVREQSNSSSAMAAAVEELTVSINSVADAAKDAREESIKAGKVANEGSKVIGQTVSDIRSIADSVKQSAVTVDDLGEHTQQITGIVNVIKEIADQTNLLALNAAIEAARAGEQGRGFAVVADEVRKLAERTASSTQEIATMIEKIQQGTNSAVSRMNTGVGQVESSVIRANEAGTAIGEIHEGADRMIELVEGIAGALVEQGIAANDVASNVEHIAKMSEQNSLAVEEAAATASVLKELASKLEFGVSQFKLN